MKKEFFVLLVTTFFLCACASAFEQARMDHFNKFADRYRLALLRGEYGQAASMIDPADRQAMDLEKLKDVKIVDYKPTGIAASEDHNEIRQDVELQYYLKSQNILKSTQYQQLWHYKDESRIWLLKTNLPNLAP